MFWPKLNNQKIKHKVFEALSKNANYRSENILGIPGTFLDSEIFYDDAPFLKDAPFLSAMVANPNHIGCHTLSDAREEVFAGTQEIEKDLIRICAEEIFHATPGDYDGYVASGGTEANIEAVWVYRNYFMKEKNASLNEIALIYSEDAHYSLAKSANLLHLDQIIINVDADNRELKMADLETKVNKAIHEGKKYFIVVLNMATTMYGSIDPLKQVVSFFDLLHLNYRLHVDAAYGGFIYPFTDPESGFNFANKAVSSVSLDAHKLLQAPYGTGIFLIRKNYMKYVQTENATYVKGTDYTLVGSRSGANAICTWMILHAYGSTGWTLKMNQLIERTTRVCRALDELGIKYFRNPALNIIAIQSNCISDDLARKYYLVPDTHSEQPKWYKIVVMPHVEDAVINDFLKELTVERTSRLSA